MMKHIHSVRMSSASRLRHALLAVTLWAGFALPAQAAMTEWTAVEGGAVRLISSGEMEDGAYKLGLEFSLEPGWHTYWRFPGESGIPPQLDFTGSSNLASEQLLFPAPSRYNDGYSSSIVYEQSLVLPLLIKPTSPDASVDLKASLFFGVCSTICVPGEASFSLSLSPENQVDTLAQTLIKRDEATLPTEGAEADQKISSVALSGSGADQLLTITANVTSEDFDLFAEGPEGSYIALPHLKAQKAQEATWTLSTHGLAQAADGSTHLTLLLVDGDRAYETHHELALGS